MKGETELKRLMNKVNKVTSYHRHDRPIPEQALDALSNAQLDYEEALRNDTTEDGEGNPSPK